MDRRMRARAHLIFCASPCLPRFLGRSASCLPGFIFFAAGMMLESGERSALGTVLKALCR